MKNKFRISMKQLAKSIKDRINSNYDVFIIVDGPRGNGKSTFMYKLNMHLGNFLPERDIVFSRQDLTDKMKLKYGLIMQDEMINAAHNRDFYEKGQKILVKKLNMYRDNYNIISGAVPFFYDLDPQVRKFVALRVTIYERGKGVLQIARNTLFCNDPWETDANRKIETKMMSTAKKGQKVRMNFSRLTTFAGVIEYGPLTTKQEARYHKIKDEKRNKMEDEIEPEKEKELTEMQDIGLRWSKDELTNEDIAIYCKLHQKKYSSVMDAMRRVRRDLVIRKQGDILNSSSILTPVM